MVQRNPSGEYSSNSEQSGKSSFTETVEEISGGLLPGKLCANGSAPDLSGSQEIFAPVPPAFADSSTEDLSKVFNYLYCIAVGFYVQNFDLNVKFGH